MCICALTGGGAFCNGQKIHVSQTDQVNDSLYDPHRYMLFSVTYNKSF